VKKFFKMLCATRIETQEHKGDFREVVQRAVNGLAIVQPFSGQFPPLQVAI